MMLEPLSGMDAGFLYMENESLHMHTLKVAILDASEIPGGIGFDQFYRTLEKKLNRLPAFRQRLIEIPFGLGHPVWADDPDFDLKRHLRLRTLPSPGGARELDDLVSEIAGRSLLRDHPLWEISMVGGLEGGRVAFICKIHHSMADGSAALAMLLRVLQDSPSEDLAPSWDERSPTRGDLLRLAGREAMKRTRAFPHLLLHTLHGLRRFVSRSGQDAISGAPIPFVNPSTAFNAALTPDRSFVSVSLPMRDLQFVKRALGVSLNDVVLAVCGGALRAHLAEQGALPVRPLVAGVPVNTHPEERGRLRGNHVGHLFTSLCTDIADPVDRVRSIHVITQAAKRQQALLGADIFERWFEYTPPKLYAAAMRLWSRAHLSNWLHAPMNLVVSTVRGPAEETMAGGVRLEALYSVGPILEGVGLNFTGWSYAGRMNLVGLSCPTLLPDLRGLVDRLPIALEELVQRCRPRAVQPLCKTTTPAPDGLAMCRDKRRRQVKAPDREAPTDQTISL